LGGNARSRSRQDYAPQIEQRFGPDWRRHPSLTAGEHSMLNTSGAEHMRLRKLVIKAFTPRTVENLKPFIEQVVHELLAACSSAVCDAPEGWASAGKRTSDKSS
jgi:cytochrome P450